MRKDTPISTQLPEWKKEVAEKVRAYGERKKRLTTPPHPLKENIPSKHQEIPVKQTISLAEEPESYTPPPKKPVRNPVREEIKPAPAPLEPVSPPDLEIWTEDIQELSRLEKLSLAEPEEEDSSNQSHLLRRVGAGLIDHTILIMITCMVLFGFSVFLKQPMEWLIFSAWKGSLSLFLFMHFIYHVYFYRSSRQTPGMLFMSLELRDPVLSSVPLSKAISRWFFFVALNIFNFIPIFLGKPFLVMDRLSGTVIRSFN